jgi:diadenylate cyclase
MDGAIVLTAVADRIVRANVHLVPDPSIPTLESGTRHRTAERVAKQTGLAVVSVSQSMRLVTLYWDSTKRVLEETPALLARADQAIQTLARYKQRLDEVAATLSALEVEDLVTLRDALTFVQRIEMVWRIAGEVEGLVAELGTEGRLLHLQLEELVAGVDVDRRFVLRDYAAPKRRRTVDAGLKELGELSPEALLDQQALAGILGYPGAPEALDQPVSPKGFRLLAKIPRLPAPVIERIVEGFGRLPRVMAANLEELLAVEGVGATRAASIKEGLARLAEFSMIERRL